MARIDLVDLGTLLRRQFSRSGILCAETDFDDLAAGGAYALLGPSGLRQDHLAQPDLGDRHAVARKILFDNVDITPAATRSAISRKCSSFR